MGKPKKCDFRPSPFIDYTTTTSSTTTLPPEDFSNYITIPNSGSICPTTTTTTTTTTSTTLPPIDLNYPCASYSFLPDDENGAVVTFAPCDNANSVNQIVVGSVQRLDFCAERSAPVSILSGNGKLIYNGGCSQFFNENNTTTTTTTENPLILIQPQYTFLFQIQDTINGIPRIRGGSIPILINADSLNFEPPRYNDTVIPIIYVGARSDPRWSQYLGSNEFINVICELAISDWYMPGINANLPDENFIQIQSIRQYHLPEDVFIFFNSVGYFSPPYEIITTNIMGKDYNIGINYKYFQVRTKITKQGYTDSNYVYSDVKNEVLNGYGLLIT